MKKKPGNKYCKKQGEQWPKQFNSVQFFAYFYIAEYIVDLLKIFILKALLTKHYLQSKYL